MNNGFNSRLRVNRIGFVLESGFQTQAIRPLDVRIDQRTIDALVNATGNGRNFSPSAFRGMAPDIIRPSAQIEGQAIIPNDWGSERLAFMLDVSVLNDFSHLEHRAIVTGYTDHPGVLARNGGSLIDPKMRLYFNNCTRLSVTQIPTPAGVTERFSTLVSEQIMRPTIVPNYANPTNSEYTLRPVDAMVVAGSAEMMQQAGTYVENYHATFQDGVKLADRTDFDSAAYLSKTVTKYARAAADSVGDVVDNVSLAENAARELNKNVTFQNQLLSMLESNYHFNDINGAIGSISYGDLCNLDPTTDSRATVMIPKPIERQNRQAMVADSRGFNGADDPTLAVSIVTQSMPTIMTRYTLGRIQFRVTNDTLLGAPVIEWQNIQGFSDAMDVRPLMPMIEDTILTDIFNPITRFGQIKASLSIVTDINQHTDVLVSLNGQAPEFFTSPQFADQLFSPLITRSYERVANMGSDIFNLAQQMSELQYNSNIGVTNVAYRGL